MEGLFRVRFTVLHNVHTGPVAHFAFCLIRTRALYAGLERPWREADYLTSIQYRGKECNYGSIHRICLYGVDRDLIFTRTHTAFIYIDLF
jgi:hypothetical protein